MDREVVNVEWQLKFPEAKILHLSLYKFDHRPLSLNLIDNNEGQKYGDKPFRFMAAWLLDNSFDEVVKQSWKGDLDWLPASRKSDRMWRPRTRMCLGTSSDAREGLWRECEA